MTNGMLFMSSLAAMCYHWSVLFNSPNVHPFYAFMVMRGCLSSLYNHGFTSGIARLYDRMVMCESVVVDIYFMCTTGTLSTAGLLLGMAIGSYLLSKVIVCRGTAFHVVAHVALTAAHTIVMRAN